MKKTKVIVIKNDKVSEVEITNTEKNKLIHDGIWDLTCTVQNIVFDSVTIENKYYSHATYNVINTLLPTELQTETHVIIRTNNQGDYINVTQAEVEFYKSLVNERKVKIV